jgi:hypothetical protein
MELRIQLQPSRHLPIMVRICAPQIWKLHVEDQPYGRPSPLVRTREALYGKNLQRTYNRPDAALKQERFSAKISEILVKQLSVRTAQVHRLNSAHIFYSSRPFEPQPINRGPWALRTARIRY